MLLLIQILWLLITIVLSCSKTAYSDSHIEQPVGSLCISSEREALLEFKFGILVDKTGRISSWLGEDCCAWAGLQCNNVTGNVVRLDLRNPMGVNRLQKQNVASEAYNKEYFWALQFTYISSSLLALQKLEYLDLSYNRFYGVIIPDFFGSFPNLRYLDLSFAGLVGSIPPQLGNLSSLRYLDLSNYDQLTTSDLSWLTHLSHLQYLGLSYLNLEGIDWWYAVRMLPSLQELYMCKCNLGSPTSSPYGKNLSSLVVLNLDGNILNVSASWLLNFKSLVHVSCINCNLYGEVPPDAFENLTSLRVIQLGSNKLFGSMPLSVLKNCNLRILDLSQNSLSGNVTELIESLPQCLLTKLEMLGLGSNLLFGSVPERLGQMTNLIVLDLSFNPLNGLIKETHLANLSKLKVLYLGGAGSLAFAVENGWVPPFQLSDVQLYASELVGSKFPAWLKSQKQLSSLILNNVSIDDQMPDWLWNLTTNTTTLVLSHNKLRGKLPWSLEFMTLLSNLDLSQNFLDGPLPNLLPSSLQYLALSNNMFSGSLQFNFEDITSLRFLDLSYNHLQGNIPPNFCQLISLSVLDLSNNYLSGKIPSCWRNNSNLGVLNIANNGFLGEVPISLCSMHLYSIYLYNNNLSGELFPSLQNCFLLEFLNVAQNKLSGTIPRWVGGQFPRLHYLILRSNKFHGRIPYELGRLGCLQVLDLAKNNFYGSIPSSFGNLSSMALPFPHCGSTIIAFQDTNVDSTFIQYLQVPLVAKGAEVKYYGKNLQFLTSMDLSCNNLTGEIPDSVTALINLYFLNLSSNRLVGKIPENIGSMSSLESLDLSMNKLSSRIPQSISSLTSLSFLNLSYNNLSGEIPTGRQLQTLDDPSIYVGNAGLCGLPLTKLCSNNINPPIGNNNEEKDDDNDMLIFDLNFVVGFFVGCLAIYFSIFMRKSSRYAYYRLINMSYKKMYGLLSFESVAWSGS